MADPERTANANENVEEMEDEEEEVEVGNNDYDDSKTDVLASLNFKALPMPQVCKHF